MGEFEKLFNEETNYLKMLKEKGATDIYITRFYESNERFPTEAELEVHLKKVEERRQKRNSDRREDDKGRN